MVVRKNCNVCANRGQCCLRGASETSTTLDLQEDFAACAIVGEANKGYGRFTRLLMNTHLPILEHQKLNTKFKETYWRHKFVVGRELVGVTKVVLRIVLLCAGGQR